MTRSSNTATKDSGPLYRSHAANNGAQHRSSRQCSSCRRHTRSSTGARSGWGLIPGGRSPFRSAETISSVHHRRFVIELQPPVAVEIPIIPQQLHRMLGTIGSVATAKVIDGAVFVAAPADTFRMLGTARKLLRHDQRDSVEMIEGVGSRIRRTAIRSP